MTDFEWHPDPADVISEAGMACERGCFVCGPPGQRLNHCGTGCCNSIMCEPPRWRLQVETWLTIEQKFNYALWLAVEKGLCEEWLAAEEAFLEVLRSKPKLYVKHTPPPPNNPSKRRGVAAAVRQKQAQEARFR